MTTKAPPRSRYTARKAMTLDGIRYQAGEGVPTAHIPAHVVKILLDQKRILPVEPERSKGG